MHDQAERGQRERARRRAGGRGPERHHAGGRGPPRRRVQVGQHEDRAARAQRDGPRRRRRRVREHGGRRRQRAQLPGLGHLRGHGRRAALPLGPRLRVDDRVRGLRRAAAAPRRAGVGPLGGHGADAARAARAAGPGAAAGHLPPGLRGPHHGAALVRGHGRRGRGRARGPHDHLERGRRPHGQQQRLQLRGQVLAPARRRAAHLPAGRHAHRPRRRRAWRRSSRARRRPTTAARSSRAPPSSTPSPAWTRARRRARRGDHRRGPRRLHGPGHRRSSATGRRRGTASPSPRRACSARRGPSSRRDRARGEALGPADRGPYALEPTALRVAWAPPASDGGQAVVRYLVQWDVSEDFRTSRRRATRRASRRRRARTECYDIEIAAVSASVPRFVRVAAYNGYDYSPFAATSPSSAVGTVRTPGPPGRRRWTSRRAWASRSSGARRRRRRAASTAATAARRSPSTPSSGTCATTSRRRPSASWCRPRRRPTSSAGGTR